MPGVVEESGLFFDLKEKFQNRLQKVEKSTYSLSREIEELLQLLNRMNELAVSNKSYYFIKRVKKLLLLMNEFISKKGYDQLEFNRFFNLLQKIKKDDRIEFLQDSVKNRIQSIARGICLEDKISLENPWLTFGFRSVNFIIRNHPNLVIKKPTRLDYVLVDGNKVEIFPGISFGDTDPKDREEFAGNLIVLKGPGGVRCFRYDTLSSINIPDKIVAEKLQNLPEKIGKISQFIRLKGIRYYLIPD